MPYPTASSSGAYRRSGVGGSRSRILSLALRTSSIVTGHMRSLSQVGFSDLRRAEQFGSGALLHHRPRLQDVAVVCDSQSQVRVLLDQEDGHALLVDLLDDAEDRLHDGGREAQRRLVEQQQPGTGTQGAL